MQNKIILNDLFKVPDSKHTKIKFNMKHDGIPAWEALSSNEENWLEANSWRRNQSNNNMGKAKYLLAFAQYPNYGLEYFIFGGFYKVTGEDTTILDGPGYDLELLPQFSEYRKRLIIKTSEKIGQNLYLRLYDNIQGSDIGPVEVYEISPQAKIESFTGYADVCMTHNQMVHILNSDEPLWKKSLSSVKAIYAITDNNNGKIYVGSASGDSEGLWQRWKSYANINNLTGGNKAFEDLALDPELGAEYITENFQYSILEIFDTKTDSHVVLRRESYWKKLLATKHPLGLNHN